MTESQQEEIDAIKQSSDPLPIKARKIEAVLDRIRMEQIGTQKRKETIMENDMNQLNDIFAATFAVIDATESAAVTPASIANEVFEGMPTQHIFNHEEKEHALSILRPVAHLALLHRFDGSPLEILAMHFREKAKAAKG